jgi:hypothetical protein
MRNLGVSIAAVVLANPTVFRSWAPWVVATLDAGVVLGVMMFGDFAERVSASYTPALVVSWAMFLLLALTAMRLKPALVLYLGGLLVAGLATAMRLGGGQLGIWKRKACNCPAPKSGDREERRQAQLVNVTMPARCRRRAAPDRARSRTPTSHSSAPAPRS